MYIIDVDGKSVEDDFQEVYRETDIAIALLDTFLLHIVIHKTFYRRGMHLTTQGVTALDIEQETSEHALESFCTGIESRFIRIIT